MSSRARARCRNCGIVTYANRLKTLDVTTQLPNGGVKILPKDVCKDVEACRARYDREALRLKRHLEHVRMMRAIKGVPA